VISGSRALTYIMALDQGTSSSRAILYDAQANVIGVAQQTFDMTFPNDGWVEQDPEVLWQTTLSAGREVIEQAGISASEIACLGITNQRETTLVWDAETDRCLYNAIVWQDRRTASRCAEMATASLGTESLSDVISSRTGLLIDPYFSSTKLAWILDHVEGARARARAGELRFGTVDSFLIWRLTKSAVHATDATNASRTQMFDIHKQRWSETLRDYFDVPAQMMPRVLDCADDFGVADEAWFGAPIPIRGVAGDQQAALVGQGCLTPGMTKSTYGTGCFMITNTGSDAVHSTQKLLTTVGYRMAGQTTYALEGSIFVAGVAIKWLRDQLGLISTAAETEAAFERTGGDAAGVFVVPAFTGLGAPFWRPHARGIIAGLTLDSSRDHVITAFLQSVVYQTHDLLGAMAMDGAPVATLRVDGGMVVNPQFCQFLADVLNIPVERPTDIETTALGAAMLAGVGQGLFENLEAASSQWACDRRFTAGITSDHRDTLLRGYKQALEQALVVA